MKKETINQIIEVSNFIDSQLESLESVGITYRGLNSVGGKLHDIILDSFGIPKDNTVEYKNDLSNPNVVCRDYWYELLFKYTDNEITIEELVSELENWQDDIL